MPHEMITIRKQIDGLKSICEEDIDNCKRLKEINKAMRLGRKEAYVDIFNIVANMCVIDGSRCLEELLNILHKKVLFAEREDTK